MQTECLHNVVTNLSCCGCRKRGNERPLGQFGEKVEDFEYKLLYVAPERLTAPSFLEFAKRVPISMVTVKNIV